MKPTLNYGLSDSLIDVVRKAVKEAKLHSNQQKLDVHEPEKDELTSQDFKKLRAGKKVKDGIDTKPKLKEEEEQIDELSRGTLKSYVKKANKSAQHYSFEPAVRDPKSGNQYRPTYTKRSKGIDLAKDKLKREEVEQMDESLDSIAKKHDMKYTTTAYGAGMKHPTKGEISINRYGEWHHKGTNKTGDSENDFSSLDKHLSTVKEEEQMDEVKLADLPRRMVKGTSYGANYVDPEGADDADDKKKAEPKRKSGPQGTMKRRFIKDKSKLRMQFK